MKTIILGVLVAASLATGQNTLWVDLSGEWRMSTDSHPEFAAPGFDDRGWAVAKLPWNRPRSGLWLRRTVNLPDWADRTQLALTLGTINDAYEVYANGVRIGDSGGLSPWDYRIPRPLTFRIPATALDTGNQSGNRLVIAIRSLRFDGFSVRSRWHLQPAAPFLVTDLRNAPVDAGERHLRDRRYDLGFQAIVAILSIVLAGLVLLAWASERKRTETLWLALFLFALGAMELLVIGLIREDFYPVQWHFSSMLGTCLVTLTFAGFAATAMGLAQHWHPAAKWLIGAALLLSSAAVSAIQFNSPIVPYSTWVSGATVVAVLLGWWLNGGIRQTAAAQLFAATILFAALLRFNTFAGGPEGQWFATLGITNNNSLVFFVASVPMVIQMLLAVAADRREGQRLAAEMEAGRGVQQLLLASAAPTSTGGYRVEAVYKPAQELGGDFHWSRTAPDRSLVVVVGDVSGKGLKAAMLVSVAIGILRNEKSMSPAAILAALNDGLAGHTGGGFVTCCCARFDADGTMTIANAGHLAPYAAGREVEVEAGLPLGVVGGAEYAESSLRLDGQFTLLSDGVVEAENFQRELFGFERTRTISTKPAQEIADAAKAWGQNDDITVVTVRRNS